MTDRGEAPLHSVGDALRWAIQTLSTVTHRPHSEAERLLAYVLQRERTALLAHAEWTLAAAESTTFIDAVRERAQGTPLPYILGEIEFFGLSFTVTPAVLIPRPETELLVERGLAWLQTHRATAVVDVGTGSGCIAVTLATQAVGLHVTGVDLSLDALRVARTNAHRHGVAGRVGLAQGDLLSPVRGPVDLLLSNPPYVAEFEWKTLPYSVRQEPAQALLAGPEGLDAIQRLLPQARSRLASPGCILVEIGAQQGNAARAMAQTAFPDARVAILPDLAGRDRILEITR